MVPPLGVLGAPPFGSFLDEVTPDDGQEARHRTEHLSHDGSHNLRTTMYPVMELLVVMSPLVASP